MFSVIWIKTWRDLCQRKKQSLLVLLSIIVSTFTLGVILISYSILSKALVDNFQARRPAMFSLAVKGTEAQSLRDEVQNYPEVAHTELYKRTYGEIQNQAGERFPMYLFLEENIRLRSLDLIQLDKGRWPDKSLDVFIEKQAQSVLNSSIGERVSITSPSGLNGELALVGIGRDVSLAQAEWENVVYAYVGVETFKNLGGKPDFSHVKVSLHHIDLSTEEIKAKAEKIKQQLTLSGYHLGPIAIFPNEPPHANITNGMFLIQIAFGVMCCVLSTVLLVNLIGAILLKEVQQIGVMKAVGATIVDIFSAYYRGMLIVSIAGLIVSLPASYFVARIYSDSLANMMNIVIYKYGISMSVLGVLIFFGVLVPLFVVSYPIIRAARVPVKQSFMPFKESSSTIAERNIDLPIWVSSSVRLALRNVFRRKSRFLLSCAVVAVGGAVLMSTYNVSEAINQSVIRHTDSKNWTARITFRDKIDKYELDNTMGKSYETFYQSGVRIVNPEDSKDGVEKSEKLSLLRLLPGSKAYKLKMLKGSWLENHERALVFSQQVAKKYPNIKIGDEVFLDGLGKYSLTGIAELFGVPTIFVHDSSQFVNGVFVSSKQDQSHITAVASQENIVIESVVSADAESKILIDHFQIIFSLMMLLSIITLFIAGSGVVLSTGANIQERRMEIGVLKAVGASKRSLLTMIAGESVIVASLSWLAACVLAIPFSWFVSNSVGILLIKSPLPLAIHEPTLLLSLPLILILCLFASLIPAFRVSGQSTKDLLSDS